MEGMLALSTCKCVPLVPKSIANSKTKLMYGPGKSLNERLKINEKGSLHIPCANFDFMGTLA